MRSHFTWRSYLLAVAYIFVMVAIVFQMVRIQTSEQADIFKNFSDINSHSFVTLFPQRGEIFDRDGHLLAGSRTVYEIGATLGAVRNPHTVALTMSALLGKEYNEVFSMVSQEPSKGLRYVVIADYVPEDKAKEIQELKKELAESPNALAQDAPSLSGIAFKSHYERTYPEGALASNILGYVNRDRKGIYGIEEKYNDLLAGIPTTVWVPVNPNRALELPKTPSGTALILTIDREIQAAVEGILQKALDDTGADAGTVIVMDPRSGEILAMSSTPQLNLNEYWNIASVYKDANQFNRAISITYEPGSVFKILTMAAALDTNTVTPTTPFLDTGIFEYGGAYIRNWDGRAWGPQDMTGCMRYSLNVCLASVAAQLGPQTFYTYLQRFGIGYPTNIDLANEASGRLKIPGDADWYPVDLATNSFGQGVAVTPIQMIMAASAIANDGKMVAPHLVYAQVSNDRQYNTPSQVVGTPIRPETARMLNEMLSFSLEEESSAALVEGYRMAGKTGTAQIPTQYGTYSPNETHASFVGWGPVDDPQFLIYVWLEKPESSPWGSVVAAPVFKEVVERLVILMDIPPDHIRKAMAGQ